MDGLVNFLPVLGIVLVFWLLVIRPGVRRERERRKMQASLNAGDRVVLTSGFFGTLVAVHDDRADIELAPGTTVSVALGAVGGLDPAAEVPEPAEPADFAYDAAETPAPRPDLNKTTAGSQTPTTPESEES